MDQSYILETQNLTKDFEGFLAVDGVDLKVREGTLHALIGPNGAGKTPVFSLLTKFFQPSSGKMYFKGEGITAAKPAAVAVRGRVRSFQISAVFPHLSESLKISELHAFYGKSHILHSADSDVGRGELNCTAGNRFLNGRSGYFFKSLC